MSDATLAYTSQSTQYSAFKLNFYLDSSCTKLWETDQSSSKFSVSRSGQPGISTDAKTVVSIGKTTPDTLYYKFDPISDVVLPKEKLKYYQILKFYKITSIFCQNSVYNGNRRVSIAGTNFFTFELAEVPEANSYVSTSSSITYTTDCTHTTGPISTVDVTSAGKNYTTLPSIISINSVQGVNADLVASSKNIGTIEKVKLE